MVTLEENIARCPDVQINRMDRAQPDSNEWQQVTNNFGFHSWRNSRCRLDCQVTVFRFQKKSKKCILFIFNIVRVGLGTSGLKEAIRFAFVCEIDR